MNAYTAETLATAQALTDLNVEVTYSDHDAHCTLAVGKHCTLDCVEGKPIAFTIDGFENIRWLYEDMGAALSVAALGELVHDAACRLGVA